MSDDFAERVATWAADHGKSVDDLRPDEREVAHRSVRATMERERDLAERAAILAERDRSFKAEQAAHYKLLSDMTVFARARVDEDEAAAKATVEPYRWHPDHFEEASGADQVHIARHDPARVLREVAFKRTVLDKVVPVVDGMADEIRGEWPNPHVELIDAEGLLRLLVAVWRDDPGYQHQWAP